MESVTYDQLVLAMWVLGLWFSAFTACVAICIRSNLEEKARLRYERKYLAGRLNDDRNSPDYGWTPADVARSPAFVYPDDPLHA